MRRVLQFRLLMLLGVFFFFASCEKKEEPVPEVLTFSPESGNAGTLVRISNANTFSSVPAENLVKFNGVEAVVVEASPTELLVKVPEDAGTGKVSVSVKGKTLLSFYNFRFSNTPVIYFRTFIAPVGEEVTIEGAGFSSDPSKNIVKFNEVQAEVLKASTTELKVKMPEGVLCGKIHLTVKGETVSSKNDFCVLSFSGFSPNNGYVGTEVKITGTGFGRPSVEFNGIAATVTTNTLTELVVKVPEGATNGKVKITVNGHTLESKKDFTFNTDFWTAKADLPVPNLQMAVAFSINGKGYIGTGYDNGAHSEGDGEIKSFWEYDPATEVWTQKADMEGIERKGAVGFSVGGRGYVATGWNYPSTLKDMWEYYPPLNSWEQKADFGGEARYRAFAFTIGDKAYVGTGSNGSAEKLKDFWEYDYSSDSWTRKADFPGEARSSAVAFTIGNKAYFGTGAADSSPFLKDFWEYTPSTDSWTRIADFGGPSRYRAVAFSIGDRGYVGLGSHASVFNQVNDFWEYDPLTDKWEERKSLPIENDNAISFSIGNRGFIGGGWLAEPGESFFEYTPYYEEGEGE